MRQTARLTGILLVAGLATAAAAGAAAEPRWTRATPFGGNMTALARSAAAPQRVYAAGQPGPLFVSTDGGTTWSPLPSASPLGTPVVDLVTDARDPLTVFARTSALGLLRSRDGGLSWSAIGANLRQVAALTQDGRGRNAWYAATSSGLYRSANGGDSWRLTAFAGSIVVTVAVDPRDTDTLFAVIQGPAVGDPLTLWQSGDHGATWFTTPLVVPGQGLVTIGARLVFDAARPGTLYALFPGVGPAMPVFRSTDGGESWAQLPAATGIGDLAAAPDGTLYGAADLGVARSTDGGESWQPPLPAAGAAAAAPRDVIVRLAPDPASPEALLAAGSEGIWRTQDGGLIWQESDQGIATLPVLSLAAAPAGPDTVVAAAGDSIFRSIDQGGTWQRVHSAFGGPQPATFMAFDPPSPRVIYGVGNDGQADLLVKSTHRGSGWQQLPVPYGCGGDSICSVSMSAVAIDPRAPHRIYVGGSYFEHFGGSGSFLLRSDDDFNTWTALPPPGGQAMMNQVVDLLIDPADSAALHVLGCDGVWESGDGGATWIRGGRGLPDALCTAASAASLIGDPRQPAVLYIGTTGRGVWRSDDGGSSFQPMNRGIESAAIASLVIDPASSARLYAGVAGKGVFRWVAGLEQWMPLDDGLPVADFNGVLTLDPQRPSLLFVGTGTQGVFRLDLAGAAPAP
jgi:photosystem II stability/assembly factor-like uncharacterized protein